MIKNEHEGMQIRDFLQMIQLFSRRLLTSVKFDGGKILVNGRSQTVRYRLKTGDRLKICFPPETKGYYMNPEAIPLDIIYEDKYIIVLNKISGMATIPSPHTPSGTLANGLLYYYEKNNIPYTVHVVTRLDRNTSGLLLIAKNRYIHSLLSRAMSDGKIQRKYNAIVEGNLTKKKGSIIAKIGRKQSSIIERTVTKNGQKAVTHYEVESKSNIHTLVNVVLDTGRTHQIRVHFSHVGYPIAGDDLYGGSTDLINRQALHCYEISIKHPITKERLSYYQPIPKDMRNLIS